MQIQEDPNPKSGIAFCMNCVGWHPDEMPTILDAYKKMRNPQKDVWSQHQKFEKKRLSVYKNKSCALCGRSYDENGELDTSWKITAQRVKQELIDAGLFGVDDEKVDLIVARCRKSVEFLFMNRMHLLAVSKQEHANGNPDAFDKMLRFTFSGALAFIITHAQAARASKNQGLSPENIKGPVS